MITELKSELIKSITGYELYTKSYMKKFSV